MIVEKIVVGEAQTNCYILGCKKTKECIIIDPGDERSKIIKQIKSLDLNPKFILLTHGHADHIGAASYLKKHFNIPIYVHKDDFNMLSIANLNYSVMILGRRVIVKGDYKLNDGDVLKVGFLDIEIIHTPGHTPGSVSILCNDIIFSGDTLFKESIGRTDLIGGSYNEIMKSLINKLLVLEDNINVYPGHGPKSTIAYEKKHNCYMNMYN